MSRSVRIVLFHGQNGHGIIINKHNTARVACCWFIIYYRLVMHGNANIKLEIHICYLELRMLVTFFSPVKDTNISSSDIP